MRNTKKPAQGGITIDITSQTLETITKGAPGTKPTAVKAPDQIIKVPSGTTNTFRLSRLFDIEAHILLKRLQELSREPYSDEF